MAEPDLDSGNQRPKTEPIRSCDLLPVSQARGITYKRAQRTGAEISQELGSYLGQEDGREESTILVSQFRSFADGRTAHNGTQKLEAIVGMSTE